jgi:iron complex outermembrane receptor protein
MPSPMRIRCILLAAAIGCPATAGHAQDRASDNAVTQAEDAFGFSVGRESLGIYSAGSARGFSPTAAGNVRIDGLYFDPVFGLSGTLVDSVSIKVGLSAQGYPFIAPSGVVDQALRVPADKPGARRARARSNG